MKFLYILLILKVFEFPEVFKGELGCYSKGKSHLSDDSAKFLIKACSVPLALQEKVDKKRIRLEDAGIIKPVSFSDWAAPILAVPKPNG